MTMIVFWRRYLLLGTAGRKGTAVVKNGERVTGNWKIDYPSASWREE